MFKNIIISSFFGLTAVILGAFGAHAFKDILTTEQLLSFETGVRYQMFHAILLFVIAIFDGFSPKQKHTLTLLFSVGILFFSGSIYLIQLTSVTAKSIWFITPLGGLFLIIGWLSMMIIAFKKLKNK